MIFKSNYYYYIQPKLCILISTDEKANISDFFTAFGKAVKTILTQFSKQRLRNIELLQKYKKAKKKKNWKKTKM